MHECMYCVVLCSTVAALCLNLGAPKVDNSHTHDTYAWLLYRNCLNNWVTCTHRCNGMHPNQMFVEHFTFKAAMGLDSNSERIYYLVRNSSMCCGARLTVGLSIVVLGDEEVKTSASMGCSHSKEWYCYIRGKGFGLRAT